MLRILGPSTMQTGVPERQCACTCTDKRASLDHPAKVQPFEQSSSEATSRRILPMAHTHACGLVDLTCTRAPVQCLTVSATPRRLQRRPAPKRSTPRPHVRALWRCRGQKNVRRFCASQKKRHSDSLKTDNHSHAV